MDRSSAKSGPIETESLVASSELTSRASADGRTVVGRTWRFTLTLWATAFGFLFTYELVMTLIQLVVHR